MAQKAENGLGPRCVKDVIEEKLFDRRRDLFTDLSLVFMDTTSLSFYGAGGETLGKRGHSKDFRPDLAQMIVALVVDAEGRPICTEMVPGNTADVTILLPVVARLRTRFGITRACVVADRGMISAATLAALEERGMEYILGTRERASSVVRDIGARGRGADGAARARAAEGRQARWSATRPTGAPCARPERTRPSRSTRASSPRKPASMASPFCAPTPRSPRFRW
jgi:hypothetical protein